MSDTNKALPVQPVMCGSCPFRTDGKALPLEVRTLSRVKADLVAGNNHVCHHAELHGYGGHEKTCRGGRDFQLSVWHSMGMICEPTDAALYAAMRAAGIEPIQDTK